LKLPKRKSGPGYQFDEEIELDYYRLQKISEGSISLNEGYAKPLDGPREVGSGMVREEHVSLSRLIDIINQRFGGELNEADQLFFDQIAEAASGGQPSTVTEEPAQDGRRVPGHAAQAGADADRWPVAGVEGSDLTDAGSIPIAGFESAPKSRRG
jgi:hypothetical protein